MKLIKVKELPGEMPPGHYDLVGRRMIDLSLGSKATRAFLIRMDPTGRTDSHAHAESEQLFYVLKGELLVKGANEEFRVREGEAAFVFGGDEHQILNGINAPTEYIVFTSSCSKS
jgi:quercetin dioxygenase-like cupin family protein